MAFSFSKKVQPASKSISVVKSDWQGKDPNIMTLEDRQPQLNAGIPMQTPQERKAADNAKAYKQAHGMSPQQILADNAQNKPSETRETMARMEASGSLGSRKVNRSGARYTRGEYAGLTEGQAISKARGGGGSYESMSDADKKLMDEFGYGKTALNPTGGSAADLERIKFASSGTEPDPTAGQFAGVGSNAGDRTKLDAAQKRSNELQANSYTPKGGLEEQVKLAQEATAKNPGSSISFKPTNQGELGDSLKGKTIATTGGVSKTIGGPQQTQVAQSPAPAQPAQSQASPEQPNEYFTKEDGMPQPEPAVAQSSGGKSPTAEAVTAQQGAPQPDAGMQEAKAAALPETPAATEAPAKVASAPAAKPIDENKVNTSTSMDGGFKSNVDASTSMDGGMKPIGFNVSESAQSISKGFEAAAKPAAELKKSGTEGLAESYKGAKSGLSKVFEAQQDISAGGSIPKAAGKMVRGTGQVAGNVVKAGWNVGKTAVGAVGTPVSGVVGGTVMGASNMAKQSIRSTVGIVQRGAKAGGEFYAGVTGTPDTMTATKPAPTPSPSTVQKPMTEEEKRKKLAGGFTQAKAGV